MIDYGAEELSVCIPSTEETQVVGGLGKVQREGEGNILVNILGSRRWTSKR